jgi:hypothetical protein
MGVFWDVSGAGLPALARYDDDGSYHGEGMGDKDARVVRRSGTANEATAVTAVQSQRQQHVQPSHYSHLHPEHDGKGRVIGRPLWGEHVDV